MTKKWLVLPSFFFLLIILLQALTFGNSGAAQQNKQPSIQLWTDHEFYLLVNETFELVIHVKNMDASPQTLTLTVTINGAVIYSADQTVAGQQGLTQPIDVTMATAGYYEVTVSAKAAADEYFAYSWFRVYEPKPISDLNIWLSHPPAVFVNETFTLSVVFDNVGTVDEAVSKDLYVNETKYDSFSQTIEAKDKSYQNYTMQFATAGRYELELVSVTANGDSTPIQSVLTVKALPAAAPPDLRIFMLNTRQWAVLHDTTSFVLQVYYKGSIDESANVTLFANTTVIHAETNVRVANYSLQNLANIPLVVNESLAWYQGLGFYNISAEVTTATDTFNAWTSLFIRDIGSSELDVWVVPDPYFHAVGGSVTVRGYFAGGPPHANWTLYVDGALYESGTGGFSGGYQGAIDNTIYSMDIPLVFREPGLHALEFQIESYGQIRAGWAYVRTEPLNFDLLVDVEQPFYVALKESFRLNVHVKGAVYWTWPNFHHYHDDINVTLWLNDTIFLSQSAPSGGITGTTTHSYMYNFSAAGFYEFYLVVTYADFVWQEWTWSRAEKIEEYHELLVYMQHPPYIEANEPLEVSLIMEERGNTASEVDYSLSMNDTLIEDGVATVEEMLEKEVNFANLSQVGLHKLVLSVYSRSDLTTHVAWGYLTCLGGETSQSPESTTEASGIGIAWIIALLAIGIILTKRKYEIR